MSTHKLKHYQLYTPPVKDQPEDGLVIRPKHVAEL